MFAERRATAMIPATDLPRAIVWYEDVLGLSPVSSDQYGALYVLGEGTELFLYQSDFAGTAQHTLLSFKCDDVLADMAALRSRGVTFLDYDLPGLKTVDGLADLGPVKNAWAKDSEGNILGFVQGM